MHATAPDIEKGAESCGRNLVMFDWDGVLADSLSVFTSIFLNACRQCRFHGLDGPGRLMGMFDGNMYETMETFGLDRETTARILRIFRRDSLARTHEISLFDHVSATLDTISAHNVVYIITSNLSAVPLKVLSREGIQCVDEVLGAETDTSKIRKIQKTMRRYPSLPAYYVGDTKGDMIEGRSAGAKTVAVSWGWHPEEKLREGRPDFMIRSPIELATLLGCSSHTKSRYQMQAISNYQ